MPRLLLVDDDISEISAVKRVLSRSGLAPLLATSGPDALASVGQARPDLLLLGATCQGGEALEAVRQLDEDEATHGIPLIILGEVAFAPTRAVQLPRPVDPAALSEQVKRLLSSAPVSPPFERRVSAPELPGSMERRSGPSDPALARKAAAEALMARAKQLRSRVQTTTSQRPAAPSQPAPAEAAAGLDALFELEPPGDLPGPPTPTGEAPLDVPAPPPLDLDLDFEGLTSPRAPPPEPAAPAVPEPPAPPVEEPPPAPPPPAPTPLPARAARTVRPPQKAVRVLTPPPPPAAPVAPVAPAPIPPAPPPPAPAVAAPSPELERAHAEAVAARRSLEEELRTLREQLEADRRKHHEELHTVIERASAHEEAALAELRDRAESAAVPEPLPPAEAPAPLFADVPPPDPAQQSARRRALSRRAPAATATEPAATAAAAAAADAAWATPTPEAPPAELRAGHLDELPMPRLLAAALKAHASGRLDVAGEAARALWFEDGRVVGATSNAAGERLDEVALRLGLLTRDQHRQVAGAAAGLASRRVAVLLVDRGYLKSGELTPLVRARTEEVVFGIFGEGNARFRWVPDLVPADERISLDRPPLALAVEGVRRRWLAPRLDAILGGPATLVTPVFGGPTDEELRLLPEERRALAGADGLRTLDEVLASSPLDALSTRQLLAALVLIGGLSVKVVQAGRPAAQVSAGIDLARVKEKLEQVRRADYFTILGLGRVATPHEVRAAAARLTAEFQPERFRGHQEEGLPARLEEIRRVLADAREVLADPILREEYERGLAS